MRVLIVGNGRMGQFHYRTVLAAGDQPVTLDPEAQADYQSWASVGDIDAAIIACPIRHLHNEALTALAQGIPRLLVEKPAAANLPQALELLNANADIAVGYIERLNPVVELLATYAIPPAHVTFTRQGPSRAGDLALNLASHDIDLHRCYFPAHTATINTRRDDARIRTIQTGGYTADLLDRTLHHPDGTVTNCDPRDLLAEQYHRFKTGKPAATIMDAVHVHRTLAENTNLLQQPAVEPIAA